METNSMGQSVGRGSKMSESAWYDSPHFQAGHEAAGAQTSLLSSGLWHKHKQPGVALARKHKQSLDLASGCYQACFQRPGYYTYSERHKVAMEPESRAHPKGAIRPMTNVWPGDYGRDI